MSLTQPLVPVHDGRMKTIMNAEDLTTISQLIAFLEGTQPVAFEVASNKDSRYQWVQRILVKFLSLLSTRSY